jgi:hypothetical protein
VRQRPCPTTVAAVFALSIFMVARIRFVIALGFFLAAAAASAAPLLSVSYDVTGGTFYGPWTSGPITGGWVKFTPDVPTTTPFNAPGVWSVYLIGAAGNIRMSSAGSPMVWALGAPTPAVYQASYAPHSFKAFSSNGLLLPASYGIPRFTLYNRVSPGAWGISAAGPPVTRTCPSPPCCPDCGGPEPAVRHLFFVGNEVRTFVPEPATGALVGLGLVLMAFVGGSRGAAARAGRARRS